MERRFDPFLGKTGTLISTQAQRMPFQLIHVEYCDAFYFIEFITGDT
jgi:hypothetical protein